MGKQTITRKEASRKLIGMTLQKAIYLNRQMEAKITDLRSLLKTTNQDHCGACGALGGRHSEACSVAEESKFLEPRPEKPAEDQKEVATVPA